MAVPNGVPLHLIAGVAKLFPQGIVALIEPVEQPILYILNPEQLEP
jgi:hypothetical protein